MAEALKSATAGEAVTRPIAHDSAVKHVTGKALYVDDMPEPEGTLHVAVRGADTARGTLDRLDLDAVREADGVVALLTAADIPGANDVGPVLHDDPVFVESDIEFAGQVLFAVVATTRRAARLAAKLARVSITPARAVVDVEEGARQGLRVLPDRTIVTADAAAALAAAPHRAKGTLTMGGQDHFYLEGQVTLAVPQEDADMLVYSSTQHPAEIQHAVAGVLGVASHAVTVEVRRMGGGFGGKESQAAQWAAIAALGARLTGKPCKMRLDRDDDIIMTGKRHETRVHYDVGYDAQGRIAGADFDFATRCGYSADLSGPVCDRTLMHADNAYYLPAARLHSMRVKTNTVSNTAFRGFGGPQGMMAIERALDAIARERGMDPLDVRLANLYGAAPRNVTPYGMTVEDNIAPELMTRLAEQADYRARRAAIVAANAKSRYLKRGIALTPVKFGISFTATHLNQAGALVHVYADGSVALNHGGTEMGQGLFQKVAQVVADEFGLDLSRVKITATNTAKVPNTSATAASSGSDLNGKAAQAAARTIRDRLTAFVAETYQAKPETIVYRDNQVLIGERAVPFEELTRQAHVARISLSSTGFYATPKIHWDQDTGQGRPFFYFAYGAACSEVLVDCVTGEMKVERVDILHDVGRSINPAIDLGQIEGGFIQGMGWLTTEHLWWTDDGQLKTHAPSTYKIPTASDVPRVFNVELHARDNREDTIHSSKAVGEPPLMLAISVFGAIGDAIASLADYRLQLPLDAPATPQAIMEAVAWTKARAGQQIEAET